MREKLLRCIGSIGRESKNFKTSHRVCFTAVVNTVTVSVSFIMVFFLQSCNIILMSVHVSKCANNGANTFHMLLRA